ncbi:TIGR04086 family membrane protein [Haloimpatiens sp. FM7315]|uniref:TIGR04086 family membrane protein n=1 Tax=Haloimpatiens sp. FM7315 TaxID=3298609 RepID=UPI00370B4E18
MNKKRFHCVLDGLIKAFIVTIAAMVIFSIISFFLPSVEAIKGVFILILTLISIMYGAFYSARKSGQRGWMLGLILAFLYMLILYIVSVFAGRDIALNFRDLIRISLALIVGVLSGMLGINM